ncbi:MAG: glycosyltransferase [Clostridiales bacterium]|nr:glycosyltransferase [Clostridiales bacterium]
MESSKVSICIPTYNGELYIESALRSIIAQTYDNIEIIVTDDCSTDNTVSIIKSNFSDVILHLNEKRLGLVGNWNHCVSLATGKYIKLMGQDDILEPNAIELQVDSLESDPEAVISIGHTNVINDSDEILMTRRLSRKNFCQDGKAFARRSLWCRNIYCEPSNILYRSDIDASYDGSFIYVPDWDHDIAVSTHGKLCYVASVIMSFRISTSSETSRLYRSDNRLMTLDQDKLISKYRKTLKISLFQYCFFKLAIRARNIIRFVYLRLKV